MSTCLSPYLLSKLGRNAALLALAIVAVSLFAIGSKPGDASASGNHAPAFGEDNYTVFMPEHWVPVNPSGNLIKVSATDPDADDDLSFSITAGNTTDNRFGITERDSGDSADVTYLGQGEDYESIENPSTAYVLTVKVTDSQGASDTATVTISVLDITEIPPEKMSAPTVTPGTAAPTTSLRVVWTAPDNDGPRIAFYEMSITSAEPAYSGTSFTSHLALTYTKLDPGTTYTVKVRAANAHGYGPWSDTVEGTTATPPTFSTSGPFRIAENEDGVRNGVDYDPYVGTVTATDSDGNAATVAITGGNDDGNFRLRGSELLYTGDGENYESFTKPTEAYALTMTATDDDGLTATTTVNIAVTDVAEPPIRMAAPTVSIESSDSLRVSWTAPDNAGRPDIAGYRLRYRPTDADSEARQFQKVDDASATSAVITGLTPGTEYQVRVRAENDEGKGQWSPAILGEIPAFSTETFSLEVAENADGSTTAVALDGNVTVAGSGNGVTYSITAGDTDRFSIDADSGQVSYTGEGEDYETGPGSYDLTVTAQHEGGFTDSVTVTITITNVVEPAPGQVGRPSLTDATETSLTFSWTALTGEFDSYRVRYRKVGDADYTRARPNTEETSKVIGNLESGAEYQVQVRADSPEVDEHGRWSKPRKARTLQKPSAPTNLTATPTGNSIALSWDAPETLGNPSDLEYKVEFHRDFFVGWELSTRTDKTTATITGLKGYTQHSVRVSAVNTTGEGPVVEKDVRTLPNKAPVFVTPPAFSLAEDAAGGTVVGVISVSDPDGDPIDLYVATIGSKFQISDDGTLSTKQGATFDYDTQSKYEVLIFAEDGHSETDRGDGTGRDRKVARLKVTVNITEAEED